MVRAADLDVKRLGSGPAVVLAHGTVLGAERTWRHQLALAPLELLRAFRDAHRRTARGDPRTRAHDPGNGHPYNELLNAFLTHSEARRATASNRTGGG
jgi:hypothetical protein